MRQLLPNVSNNSNKEDARHKQTNTNSKQVDKSKTKRISKKVSSEAIDIEEAVQLSLQSFNINSICKNAHSEAQSCPSKQQSLSDTNEAGWRLFFQSYMLSDFYRKLHFIRT